MQSKTASKHTEHEPPTPRIRKQLLISVIVLFFLIAGTIVVVLYGTGYRFGFQKGKPLVSKTGILVANSTPKGAQVAVDGHLTTATDNTVNLRPGQYNVKITKDGYFPWEKNVEVKEQVVSNADALLFPAAPALQPVSTFNIEQPTVDPSGTKIAFRITNQAVRKNGIYVLDMTSRTFPVLAGQSSSTQVVSDTVDAFSKSTLSWSPDGEQILASLSSTLTGLPTYYLLKANILNDAPQDVTATLESVQEAWNTQRVTKDQARLQALKPSVQKIIGQYARILAWAPDETKILYQASASGQLPLTIKPRRIGNNFLYERRDLQENSIYVYDITEDINTRVIQYDKPLCEDQAVACSQELFTWFPDSYHLVFVNDKKIEIVEADGSNKTTIYAGPFVDHYVFPWPDASKIVILTNLNNQSIPPTLYTISLK